jgi:hypothetical protein
MIMATRCEIYLLIMWRYGRAAAGRQHGLQMPYCGGRGFQCCGSTPDLDRRCSGPLPAGVGTHDRGSRRDSGCRLRPRRGRLTCDTARRILHEDQFSAGDLGPASPRAAPGTRCTLVTPNATEARLFSGVEHPGEQGRQLCAQWHARAVAVTSAAGARYLTEADPPRTRHLPPPDFSASPARSRDTLGAGDQFAVAAALALLEGADAREAVEAAVCSAAQFVQGRWSFRGLDGFCGCNQSCGDGCPSRPVARTTFEVAARVRRSGGRLVATAAVSTSCTEVTSACSLQARALGDALVVCLNPMRPYAARKVLAARSCRSKIRAAVLCRAGRRRWRRHLRREGETPAALLSRLQPDLWVKGTDYADCVLPEAEVV